MANRLEDADYTLTITETPLLDESGEIAEWLPCYWEIRNSAMGEWICEAIRTSKISPWLVTSAIWEISDGVTLTDIRLLGVPDLIIHRMVERGLYA